MVAVKRGEVRAERGSVAIEAAMLVPAFIVVIALVVAAGRMQTVDGVVAQAARDAARAASLTNPVNAQAGVKAAQVTLASQGVTCASVQVVPHTNVPAGQVGTVTATLSCTVKLSDLWSGLPGSVPVKQVFTAEVDVYRSK